MFCRGCDSDRKNRVSGQGFTEYTCKKCGQVALWYNTNVPNYCTTCSHENLVCAECGRNLILEVLNVLLEEISLYEIALNIGISETSLRKYMKTGSIGPKVYEKIKDFTEEQLEIKGGF